MLDLLTALVEKSLVIYEEPRIGEARYRMLETIRDYARERLREAGEEEALRERHRDWFLDLTEQASPELSGTRQRAWLDRVEEEHDNLRSALEWSEATDIEAGLRMAGALATFWWARGYPAEGRARLASLLAHPEARAPAAARIRALQGAGLLADRQSDYPAAHAHFQESLALCRKLGDWRRAATALQCLGLTAAAWESDYTAARAYYEQALAIRRELRDHSGVAHTLELIGNLERLEGRYARARALYEQSLDLFRDLGNHAGIAVMLDQLGNLAWHGGEHARARDLLEESLAIRRETGNKGGIALSLFSLGEVALSVGDDAGAQALFEESRSLQEALGGRRAVANVLHRLGELHLRRQEYDRAGELLTGSLRLHRGLGNRYGILTALESLAALALALGQADRAARLWGASAALREELRLPMLPHDRVHYERRVAAARAEMGEAAFTAGWEAGRAMAMQEAFEMAVQRVNVAPTTGT